MRLVGLLVLVLVGCGKDGGSEEQERPPLGDTDADTGTGAPVAGPFGTVSAGYYHTCAIDTAGAISCWGDDDDGQVSDAPSGTFDSMSAGYNHNCAIDTAGDLSCWGYDGKGGVSGTPTSL